VTLEQPHAQAQPHAQVSVPASPAPAISQSAEVAVSPLLMVIGVVALAGLPLLGIAGFLLLWVLRRVE
jgi:hypothetical protein